MITYIIFLCIPIFFAIFAKYVLHKTITVGEFISQCIVSILACMLIWNLSMYFTTYDTKIENGKLLQKETNRYTRTEIRSCGEKCTRTVTIYGKEWFFKTTIGNIPIEQLESEVSLVVSAAPDPKLFKDAKIGDHVAKTNQFKNYLKYSKASLYHSDLLTDDESIPQYPKIFDKYKVNHVITDFKTISPNQDDLEFLSESLKELQKTLETEYYKKDINVLVYVTDKDSNAKFSVQRAWKFGKLNDVIIYVGLDKNLNISWTSSSTWLNSSGNELFIVKLTDLLEEKVTLKELSLELKDIVLKLSTDYKEFDLSKLEYMEKNATPSFLLTFFIFCFMILFSAWLSRFFHINDFNQVHTIHDINWI